MAKFRFQFEVAKDADNEQTLQLIEERLSSVDGVEKVKAQLEAPRLTGLEIIGIISTTVLIVDRSDELIEHLRKLVQSLKGLVQDIKGLKDAFVEVEGKRIPIAEVKEETLQHLEAETKP